MPTQAINRETVSGEALFILRNLRENGRQGRSNKLAEVKAALEPSVSLEFDTYFFFLRKFHYIALDREAQLKLTEQGERVVDGDTLDRFGVEVDSFFFDQIQESQESESRGEALLGMETPEVTSPGGGAKPPPPPTDLLDDAEPAIPLPGATRPMPPPRRVAPIPPLTVAPLQVAPLQVAPPPLAPPPLAPPPLIPPSVALPPLAPPPMVPPPMVPPPVAVPPLAPSPVAPHMVPQAPVVQSPAAQSAVASLPAGPPPLAPLSLLEDEPLVPAPTPAAGVSPSPAGASASSVTPAEMKRESSLPQPSAPAYPSPMPTITSPISPATATATASAAKGTDLDVRYVKFDPLGSGPLGTVFKGRHNALGTDISIKELKDIFGYFSFLQRGDVIKRLKKELCAQAQVRHPNVVQILDQSTDVSRPFFVMELLRGSLRERLEASGGKGLLVTAAIRHFLQLSYGLKAAHAQGLTHHNLKPENILFDAAGNAKVGDFGLARVVEVDASKGLPQVFVGTGGMAYLAPELLGRAGTTKEAGPSADVYGLGILLYEMLTGQLPGRRSPLPSEVNDEVPSKLDPIFDKMTQDRLQNRYPDFDAMLADFYGAFSDGEYLQRGDLILWSEAPRP